MDSGLANTEDNTASASKADFEPALSLEPEPEVEPESPGHTTVRDIIDPTTTVSVPEAREYTSLAPMTEVDAATGLTSGHHLLHDPEPTHNDDNDTEPHVTGSVGTGGVPPKPIALRLYTSHFLSTWNSRLFEFGAALFLTSVFPGTLLPVSIYSLVRNAGYIVFAQPVGHWINRGSRLNVIRTSIVGQRLPVAASCALLLVLAQSERGERWGYRRDNGIFAVIVLLAVVEKLCSTMNTISIERDWVRVVLFSCKRGGNQTLTAFCCRSLSSRKVTKSPVGVSHLHIEPAMEDGDGTYQLLGINARMRRIDLFCKLMGPLTISLVAIASTKIAIYTTLGMNVASVLVEYVFIEQVGTMASIHVKCVYIGASDTKAVYRCINVFVALHG